MLPLTTVDLAANGVVLAAVPASWRVDRMLLFGSTARGDDEPDGVLELFAITPDPASRAADEAVQEAAQQAGIRHGAPVQLVIHSHDRRRPGVTRQRRFGCKSKTTTA